MRSFGLFLLSCALTNVQSAGHFPSGIPSDNNRDTIIEVLLELNEKRGDRVNADGNIMILDDKVKVDKDAAPCNGHMNLALDEPSAQSSIARQGESALAVDGSCQSSFFLHPATVTCASTDSQSDPWWGVDLGEPIMVTEVRITNRGDCCESRLHDFYVMVTSASIEEKDPWMSGLSEPCAIYEGELPSGKHGPVTIACNRPLLGRYVIIYIPGDDQILTLCEVEVYGERLI